MINATQNYPIMLTIKEISEDRYQGKVSTQTIWRLVQQKKIRSIRLSPRKLMIPLAEIEKYENDLLEESTKEVDIIK